MILRVLGLLTLPAGATAQGVSPDVTIIAEARSRASGMWPGFDPAAIPVLLFDGYASWLVGHPGTPEGFRPTARANVQMYAGRHPEITANSSVDLAGVATATVMPFRPGLSAADRAGVVAHEMFHVFTRRRHAGWTANEVDAFTYPVADAEVLALRRIEYQLLRGALRARADVCRVSEALRARTDRYQLLGATSIAYERGNELAEGLAEYVERRVAGVDDRDVMPERRVQPEDVRETAYSTGHALGRLLDRLLPSWKDSLDRDTTARLDVLLQRELARQPQVACPAVDVNRQRIRQEARVDVEALDARRKSTLRGLEERTGWRITIIAGREPLWPQRFDPLNIGVLDSGVVLHRRMVRLGNGAGTIEVLGHEAVTRAAGAHPLFNGIRALEVTGIADPPRLDNENGSVRITSGAITATLRGASSDLNGSHITIRLP